MNKRNFAAALLPMLLFLLLLAPCALHAGFDFDDLEKVEQSEQEELLEAARKAAKGWHFGEAESYLKQARQKAYAPDDIASVEKLIADSRDAYEAEQERKRQEEERRRREEEAARVAEEIAQSNRNYRASSGGSVSQTTANNSYKIKKRDGVWVTIECHVNGYVNERTIRDCKNGYWEAGGSGFGGCNHSSLGTAATQVCGM